MNRSVPVIAPSMGDDVTDVRPEIQYLMGCRTFEQFCCTLRALAMPEQFCPFCATELERRDRKPILTMGGWQLFENEFPHKATARMELIVPRRHVRSPAELRPDDWVEIGALVQMSQIKNGGLVMRFGDPRYHVGTIEHLHFNLIEPTPGVEYRPPLSKDVSELRKDFQRAFGFYDQLWEMEGDIEWLFSDEGIAQTQPKGA